MAMNRMLPLSLLAGVLVVVLTAAALSLAWPRLVAAQGESCSLDWLDQNCNGSIDIGDLFTVIDLYFSGEPIPEPPVGGDNKWVRSPIAQNADGLGLANSVEDGPIHGSWYLSLECSEAGNPGVYIRNIRQRIFSSDEVEHQELSIETVLGNVSEPDAWFYFPAGDGYPEYFSHRFPESLISAMLDSDEMTIVTPYVDPSTVTFPISGLSEYIDEPADICTR